jgi:hypothetical protein
VRVAYAPCPLLGSEASKAARDKRKAEVTKKPTAKRLKTRTSQDTPSKTVPAPPKTGPLKKIGVVKIMRPRARTEPQGTSQIELTLMKLVRVSKKFCQLDVAAPSHGIHGGLTMTHIECTSWMLAFNNLSNDSSPHVRKTPSPKRVGEKRASPLPSVSA